MRHACNWSVLKHQKILPINEWIRGKELSDKTGGANNSDHDCLYARWRLASILVQDENWLAYPKWNVIHISNKRNTTESICNIYKVESFTNFEHVGNKLLCETWRTTLILDDTGRLVTIQIARKRKQMSFQKRPCTYHSSLLNCILGILYCLWA